MATIKDDFNNVVAPINKASYEVEVLTGVWNNITADGKEELKAKYVTLFEEAEVNIAALKDRISNL
jgi:hypothetical protein